MRFKWGLYFTMAAMAVALIWGIREGRSYTDISKDSSYLETIYVAQIPEEFALLTFDRMKAALPKAPLILKVTAAGEIEHLARTSRQLVEVTSIHEGSGLSPGDKFYLTFGRWSLALYSEPYSMERGFVNVLNPGEEYLVFLEGEADGLGEELPVYRLFGEEAVAPVFSCENHENKILEMDDSSTYVPYQGVKGNEFFAATETAMDAFLALKAELLRAYP